MSKSFFQSKSIGDEDEFDIYEENSSPKNKSRSNSSAQKMAIVKKKPTVQTGFKSPKKGSLPREEFTGSPTSMGIFGVLLRKFQKLKMKSNDIEEDDLDLIDVDDNLVIPDKKLLEFFSNPDHSFEGDDELVIDRILRNRIPSMFINQNLVQKQRLIIVKYFEENDKFAKIVPRTISYIVQKKKMLSLKEVDLKMVEASILINLIREDDRWLEKNNPIISVSNYIEEENQFHEVDEKEEFKIKETNESSYTFHVKRKYPVSDLIDEISMTFENSTNAKQHVNNLTSKMNVDDSEPGISVRYYDLYHHGYVRLFKDDDLPVFRAGTNMVRILVEKHIHSNQQTLQVSQNYSDEEDEPMDYDEAQFLFEDLKKTIDFVKERDYSQFVDVNKIPVYDNKKYKFEYEREKAWSKIKKLPTKLEEVTKLKNLIRNGIPFELKKEVYFAAADAKHIIEFDKDLYQRNFIKVFGTFHKKKDLKFIDVNPTIIAEFGGKFIEEEHYLNKDGIQAAKRLLCVIGNRYSEVEYCPSLIYIICFLLYIMDEHEVYGCVSKMVERNMKDNSYFRITKLTHQLFIESFKDILKKSLSNVWKHFEKLEFDIENISVFWFDKLFFSSLPFEYCLQIFDGFMSEGNRVYLRAGFAVLKKLEKEILECSTSTEVLFLLKNKPISFQKSEHEDFFKNKFKLALGRKQLSTYDAKNKDQIQPTKLIHDARMYTRPKIIDESAIIETEPQWEILCNWFPLKRRMQSLHRIYLTSKDGFSLLNLYSTCKDVDSMLILINAIPRDENDIENEIIDVKNDVKYSSNSIFGVYCGEAIENSNQMQGTTDTFVFSLTPNSNCYKWTKKNDYFVLGKENEIIFGYGENGSALKIDDQLQYGSSHSSHTFDNEPLCGYFKNFEITRLEVYILK